MENQKKDIKSRLENLEETIQKRDFLEGRGLSNEQNIRIFSYDVVEESIVKYFLSRLQESKNLLCKVIEFPLYSIVIEILLSKKILDKVPNVELKNGKEHILKQIRNILNEKTLSNYLSEIFNQKCNSSDNVIFITQVGEVQPFIQLHSLLEIIQPIFSNIPVVAMYPGKYDGYHLSLFDKYPASNYYRAFNDL